MVADPEESEMEQICNVKDLSEELEGDTVAVFMMATYGEGDPTDNAQEFFDWLKDGGVDLKGECMNTGCKRLKDSWVLLVGSLMP